MKIFSFFKLPAAKIAPSKLPRYDALKSCKIGALTTDSANTKHNDAQCAKYVHELSVFVEIIFRSRMIVANRP